MEIDRQKIKKPVKLPKLDERIPRWIEDKLMWRDCPFCGSVGEAEYIRPDNLYVNLCHHCGTFFVSPSPTMECLHQFYSNYFSKHVIGVPLNRSAAKYLVSVDPLEDFRVLEMTSVIEPKGKRVLDVGCGDGNSLIKFKKLGANIEGIDLDQTAVTFVRDELAIKNVKNCNFEHFDTETKYDVILMSELIEHPPEPLSILKKAKKLLAENGILVIWTPNASFAHNSNDPIIFRVDLEHMQYLTFKTCNFISNDLDLEIIHLESVGFQRDRFDMLKYTRNSSMQFFKNYVQSVKINAMANIRNLPAIRFLNRMRRSMQKDIRLGQYNLFCIFQNVA